MAPTENDSILRRLTDEYDAWENGLAIGENKLFKSEVDQCVGIIMKYGKSNSFPNLMTITLLIYGLEAAKGGSCFVPKMSF